MVAVEASVQEVEQELPIIAFLSVDEACCTHAYITVIADETDFVANVTAMSFDSANDGVDAILDGHDL